MRQWDESNVRCWHLSVNGERHFVWVKAGEGTASDEEQEVTDLIVCLHVRFMYDDKDLIASTESKHHYDDFAMESVGGSTSTKGVHLDTSYLDGQFVLDSRSGDLWGWEHHTHIYHAVENVVGQKQRRCDEGHYYTVLILHFIRVCVMLGHDKHACSRQKGQSTNIF